MRKVSVTVGPIEVCCFVHYGGRGLAVMGGKGG